MKKRTAVSLSVIALLLVGCSSKKTLPGDRVDILFHEDSDQREILRDGSNVEISAAIKNNDCVQSGYNASHVYAPVVISSALKKLWSANFDFESTKDLKVLSSPIVANEKVCCLDAGGILYAFDKSSGKLLWRKSTTIRGKDGQVGGSLAYVDGKIITSSSFAEAMAFDADSGEMLWRIKLSSPCKGDGITVSNGKAYVLCDNSTLHVIDVKNGKICWSHSGMNVNTTFVGSAAVAVKDGVAYVAYPSGEIFALLENGGELWSATMSKFSFVDAMQSFSHPRANVVACDNLVYVTNVNKQLIAYDSRSGTMKWKKNFGGFASPVVSGNSLFVLNEDSEIICYNKDSGARRWISSLSVMGDNITWNGLILTSEGLAAVSDSGKLVFVSFDDGQIKKTIRLDGAKSGVSVSPVVADEILYVPTDSGKLVAYK